ncbi:hypothetical protein ACVBEH_10950 [Roseateles sp. GG27B]
MSIYAFDKGMSMYPLAAAIRASTQGKSGLDFTVAADDDTLAFCPLQFLETKGDRAWAMGWIDTILALNGLAKGRPAQRDRRGHHQHVRKRRENSLQVLADDPDEAIREAMTQTPPTAAWVTCSTRKPMAARRTSPCPDRRADELGEKYALPVCLSFRRIERSRTGQPAVIILDEAWRCLAPGFPRQDQGMAEGAGRRIAWC